MPFSLPFPKQFIPTHSVVASSRHGARRARGWPALLAVLALGLWPFAGAQAQSDSGLGLIAAEARISGASGQNNDMVSASLSSVWQVGRHQSLQFDLGYADYAEAATGRVAGHLSLQPAPGLKYGLFGIYEDLNDAAVYGLFGGVEGMWMLAPGVWAEAQVGAGVVQPTSTDFLFAAGRLTRDAGPVEIGLGYQIAAIDELDMGLTVHSIELGMETAHGPLRLGVALRHDRLSGDGRGAGHQDTALVLSVGWRFGMGSDRSGSDGIAGRMYRTPRPIAPLWRAGVMRF